MVNAYLVRGEKSSILVDTGLHGNAKRILNTISGQGISPKDISLIVITHAHSDHTGNLRELVKATGAKIAIGKTDSEYLAKGLNFPLHPRKLLFKIVARFLPSRSMREGIKADLVIDSETSLSDYGIKGKIIPTPGHTAGSVSVVLDRGEAFVGDLFSGGFIRKRRVDYPHFYYDTDVLEKSINKIIDLKPRIIYTGHGGPFNLETVKRKFGKKA